MEWYRWDTEAEAQACLDYINSNETFPITGRNAATGEEVEGKQKTTCWADEVIECTDGKWGFPRIPEATLDAMGVTEDERETFLLTFNPIIEEFNPTWIPEPPPYPDGH